METARRELALVGQYDHVVLNEDLSRAADELAAIVNSHADSKEA